MTNGAGATVGKANYERFGNATVTTGTVTNNLRLAGQYYDSETGLHYNWHRYYDPKTGRYISSDPVGLKAGLNTYAYVANNPLRWIDPTGLEKVCRWVTTGFYDKSVPALIRPELGYWDTICVPMPKPGPGIPEPP